MFSKEECLASAAANGCRKIGRNLWTDGEYNFTLKGAGDQYRFEAARIDGKAIGMREALRPFYRDYTSRKAAC